MLDRALSFRKGPTKQDISTEISAPSSFTNREIEKNAERERERKESDGECEKGQFWIPLTEVRTRNLLRDTTLFKDVLKMADGGEAREIQAAVYCGIN